MCGIAFDARRPAGAVDEPALNAMIETLRHRGPDLRRTWISHDGRIGLAHARLSIVDPSPRGNQPMANEDGNLRLTGNGEIYNHLDLRRELLRRGHEFHSNSDNEVLLHGYEEWGLGVLERLRGMFAFALADVAAGRVIAVRDRLGEKPLLYVEDEEGVAGASELPALRAAGRVSDEVDPRAIAYFLARNLRHVPEPLSIFADVRKLPPAHLLVIEDGAVVERSLYWRPTWRGPRAGRGELRRRVEEAVALQREADVEVGALLSGGVDSSIVVGLAAADGARPATYALGRDGHDEELARARAASERFGTRHHEATFDPAQLGRLDALIAQLGEPIALLPLTHADVLLGRVHEERMRVVLSGNGADELLYGYPGVPRLRRFSLALRILDALPRALVKRLAQLRVPGGAALALRLAALPNRERKVALYRDAVAASATLLRPEFRGQAVMPEQCPVFSLWSDVFDGHDYIELSQFLTLMIEDAHSVTISGDLVGMHHSIEVRAPFLDHHVVETALRLPIREKAGPLWRPEGKLALKAAFEDLVSSVVTQARKLGFGNSLQESDLIRGVLREQVETRILEGPGIARYFDTAQVQRKVREHMSGAADHGKLLLSLYAFESWHEQLVAAPRPAVSAP